MNKEEVIMLMNYRLQARFEDTIDEARDDFGLIKATDLSDALLDTLIDALQEEENIDEIEESLQIMKESVDIAKELIKNRKRIDGEDDREFDDEDVDEDENDKPTDAQVKELIYWFNHIFGQIKENKLKR